MIKSKQRMDFNMTSNNQRNIPPKKTDSEPSKATESKFAKAPEAASPKEADAQSSTKSHRRRAYLDGMDSWVDVTENGIKSTAWSGGLSHSFTYNDMHVGYATLPSGKAAKTEALVSILAEHPEGIVLYDRTRPHAVLLTDYTNGVFYCSDPSNGVASGRVPLSAASISIGGASCYWYITEDGNDDGLELLEEAVQAEEAAAETETAAETEVAAGEESSSQDWWTSLFG